MQIQPGQESTLGQNLPGQELHTQCKFIKPELDLKKKKVSTLKLNFSTLCFQATKMIQKEKEASKAKPLKWNCLVTCIFKNK